MSGSGQFQVVFSHNFRQHIRNIVIVKLRKSKHIPHTVPERLLPGIVGIEDRMVILGIVPVIGQDGDQGRILGL